jgi:hydroxylamine reductase
MGQAVRNEQVVKEMFCYQCEQTAGGTGCTVRGVCGKSADVAALQDLVVAATKHVAHNAHQARQLGARNREIDAFVVQALFTTVTNVDFDPERVAGEFRKALAMGDKARALYEEACDRAGQSPEPEGRPLADAPKTLEGMIKLGRAFSVTKRREKYGDDIAGLQELLTYGLKGAAAYMDHARVLGKDDPELYAAFHEQLAYLNGDAFDADELTARCLKAGELNLKVMGLLDAAHTETYGHPEPTTVRVTPVKGKAIVVSGHDLRDLELLLRQTEGKGINVYTHGEMLPCLAYPGLKKYAHLVGNYGGAWQDQAREFAAFPGAILMTTNCLQRPADAYKDRIFTTGLVAWPGVQHIGAEKDFTPVIEAALAAPGFEEDAEEKTITIGFGRNAVMNVADKVVEAVKGGDVRHFFLVGGCDGARPGRNYYTRFAQEVPDDCVILTLACGKYRFNKLPFGAIGGIPRLLDVGQCNDAYSAVQIALVLADAFDCDVNELPLSLILSWYEQKAVAILLTLLHLGIKDMRLGPTLPAFVTPTVLNVLVETFDLQPVTSPEEDLQAILG